MTLDLKDFAFAEPTLTPQVNRPPSGPQKVYLRRDEFNFQYLLHFCRLYLKERLIGITYFESTTSAVDRHRDNPEKVPPFHDYITTLRVLSNTSIDSDVFADIQKELTPTIQEILFIYKVAEGMEVHHIDDESKELHKIAIQINNPTAFLRTILTDRSGVAGTTNLFLYILDFLSVIDEGNQRGHKIARFLPFYPSKEINNKILAHYRGPMMVTRLLESTGEGIDLKDATWTQFEELKERLRKEQENKKTLIEDADEE